MSESRAEEWARYAAEVADAAIVVHAPDTSILWANQEASRLLGIERDALLGKLAADPSFHLLDADGERLPLESYPVVRALRTGAPLEGVEVGIVRQGAPRTWGRLSLELVREGRAVVAAVSTFVDDTRLHEAREALAESEARFTRAVAGTQDALWEIDLTTGRAWYAPRFEALLGLQPGSLEGRTDLWQAFVHPDDQDAVYAAYDGHLRGRVPYDIRYRMRHADGSWRHFHARGRAVRGEDGTPRRIAGAVTDITSQVLAERARRETEERLEVAGRLESLAVLAGGVAHDFNNLLMGILGATETARARLDDREAADAWLEVVEEGVERAAGLTRQLLAYAGASPAEEKQIDPAELVGELVRLVRGALPSRADLGVRIGAETPPVRCDPTQLHQVLMNLLVNAAEAVDEGGRVEIRTSGEHLDADALARLRSCAGEPGAYAVVEVIDDGRGMDERTLARVFEPFFTTKPHGHGLGLAAAHGLVRACGGFLDVRSELGVGTHFRIGLPAASSAEMVRSVRVDPRRSQGEGRRVLIVEDGDLVRQVLTRMLQGEGFEVLGLPDGAELHSTLETFDPDLLVLDVTLPGKTGPELLAELRDAGDDRPVLLSSGHARAGEVLAGVRGRTDFLAKPFDSRALRERLAALLAGAAPTP
jgi:PAS domain S-box-containing protein